MPRIFVSHSHRDNEVGLRLVADLRARLGDDAVWYDISGGLRGGDEWWRKIVDEITARDTFIVILSPDAVSSDWVQREMDIAYFQHVKQGKCLIPLAYRRCQISTDWELIQALPISHPTMYPDAYESQLANLLNVLLDSAEPPAATPVSPDDGSSTRPGTSDETAPDQPSPNIGSDPARQVTHRTMRHGPLGSAVLGVRMLLCCAVLAGYWLLMGYTTPSIFPLSLLRISGSERLIVLLRGNDSNTEAYKAAIILFSLTIDWLVVGTILSRTLNVGFFSLPYAVVANISGAILMLVFFAILALYVYWSRTKWEYIDVVNLRKILAVVMVTALLIFASQIHFFGAAFLYFPILASVLSVCLFFYGLIRVDSKARMEQRLKAHRESRARREAYLISARTRDER